MRVFEHGTFCLFENYLLPFDECNADHELILVLVIRKRNQLRCDVEPSSEKQCVLRYARLSLPDYKTAFFIYSSGDGALERPRARTHTNMYTLESAETRYAFMIHNPKIELSFVFFPEK